MLVIYWFLLLWFTVEILVICIIGVECVFNFFYFMFFSSLFCLLVLCVIGGPFSPQYNDANISCVF